MMLRAFAISTFVASVSVAQFTGTWIGSGTLSNGSGQTENCQLQIEIEQTELTFAVKKSVFQCPSHTIKNRPSPPLDIRDGQLWFGTTRLGTISQNAIHTELRGNDGRFQSYDLKILAEQHLIYKDHIDWTQSYKTEMTGELTKTP